MPRNAEEKKPEDKKPTSWWNLSTVEDQTNTKLGRAVPHSSIDQYFYVTGNTDKPDQLPPARCEGHMRYPMILEDLASSGVSYEWIFR